jgi:hypothetical protein
VGEQKKDVPSVGSGIARMFHASLLILGAVIALNLAVAYVQPILPWIIWGIALSATSGIVIAIWRWRKSRW